MIKRLLILFSVFQCSILYAQTLKTDVLVIGGTASGVAAAIQSARSNVKTVFACDGIKISGITAAGSKVTLDLNRNTSSGIWGEFRKRIREANKDTSATDTTQEATLSFESGMATNTLKNIADTVKNLSYYTDGKFKEIKKDGERWEVLFTRDGKNLTIKAKVIIDATENSAVALKAGAELSAPVNYRMADGNSRLYRTSIACGEALPGAIPDSSKANSENYPPYPFYYIPLEAVVAGKVENILVTETALPGNKDIQFLPVQLTLGQGVGAAAAFCAFFKTTTARLHTRIIQGEVLDFKGYLLPIADVKQSNPYWRAVQQVCATGLLRGVQMASGGNPRFCFLPDSPVSTAEIEPVLKEIYTRAFLWFNREKPGKEFTVGNMLSFISEITLTSPDVLNKSMQKAWTDIYRFKNAFDINRPVTRLEFAVLANRFLNPFARTVSLSGKLIN
ncbi:MAG TPA: FAD-dependent oxidoreductase [Mucilaginibacter sp.]|nr:FAD-dependent oxidoreductase [Mucilaginibacter sp.]